MRARLTVMSIAASLSRRLGKALLLGAGWLLAAQNAQAQSILRDAETEALFREMANPLVKAAGLDPKNVDIVLVNDPDVNAFVAGGQAVYLNAGLINQATSAAEVQGVIAHELGHVVGGHAIDDRGSKAASNVSILSLLLAEAADAAGAQFLSTAGISGRGSLEFFHKLLNMENRMGFRRSEDASFYSTHPMTNDRITFLQDVYEKDPAWKKPDDAAMEARFVRVKAKLAGYLSEPPTTYQTYPEYLTSDAARYARAYAYHKDGFLDKATAEIDKLLSAAPDDPYYLELKGQILLEAGKPAEAIAPLRRATALTNNQPLIATTFGHAMLAADERISSKEHLAEAQKVLKAAVSKDRENPFAWYVLGILYARNGDTARARLASAEQQSLSGRWAEALQSAETAKGGLPFGSADAIRAEDIALQSKSALARMKKRK
jgi:predicted Zn-dependent protease